MTLLNPIWLLGLAGLIIPISIHLLSRKEGKTIRIGSIRFLKETSTSRFSSIRLNEVILLTLRSLLIIFIVLFLCTLLLNFSNRTSNLRWVVVEKGLETDQRIKPLLDSLTDDDYEVRTLAKGFPLLDQDSVFTRPDYYKLAEDLATKRDVNAIVLAHNSIVSFKGKRIALPENITWLSFPSEKTTFTQSAVANHNTILVRKGYSVADETVFETSKLSMLDYRDQIIPEKTDTLKITVAYGDSFEYDRKIMTAVLGAIQTAVPHTLVINEIPATKFKNDGTTDWLIWLSDSPLEYSGNSLTYEYNSLKNLLIRKSKGHWILSSRIDASNVIQESLSIQILKMLFEDTINRERIAENDNRMLPERMAWSHVSEAGLTSQEKSDGKTDHNLILVIILLFVAERILAFYRKQ